MKILFTCGGTAGHVNPALAVAGYICKKEPGSQVWLSGGKGNIEEKLAAKAGYPILQLKSMDLSLEDIFIKLTGDQKEAN